MKLLKKKVNVFGKSIPVLAIFVLGIALVSAALVPYLSNVITGSVIVASPMAMSIGGTDYVGTQTLTFANTHGGETFSYKVWSKNQGNINVSSYPIMTIITTNEAGWTGKEFTSVHFEDANYNPTNGIIAHTGLEILPLLYVVDDNGGDSQSFEGGTWNNVADNKTLKLVFHSGNLPITYVPEVESWNNMTVTTALTIAPDTYEIKLCHINDLLTGSCE